MDTNKMREHFEAALVAMHVATGMPECDARTFLEIGSNGYTSVYTKAAWWAWQASREAVAIDLSMLAHQHDEGPLYYRVDDVHAAIEAQGLKVAP